MNKRIYIFLIMIGLIIACGISYNRFIKEDSNMNVEIIVDYSDLSDFSRSNGFNKINVLNDLKAAGVTTIAFTEITPEELVLDDRIILYKGEEILKNSFIFSIRSDEINDIIRKGMIKPDRFYLLTINDDFQKWLCNNLVIYKGKNRVNIIRINKQYSFIEVIDSVKDFTVNGIGFIEENIKNINDIGFNVILRPENKDNLNKNSILQIWDYISYISEKYNMSGILFGGIKNEVLGYPEYLDIDIDKIKNFKSNIGIIEIYQAKQDQKGIRKICLTYPDKTIRVQSIPDLYLKKITPVLAKDMFCLGVSERNIRWVYLRLFRNSFYGENLLQTNIKYIKNIINKLSERGFRFKKANPICETKYPFYFYVILSLTVASVFLILIRKFYDINKITEIILFIIFLLTIPLSKIAGKFPLACKILALLAGISFSALSLILILEISDKIKVKRNLAGILIRTFVLTFIVFGFTVSGGLLIVALLNDTSYLMNVDQFRGIKLLIIIVPVLLFIWYLTKHSRYPKNLLQILREPVYIWQAVLAFIMILAGIIYVIRSGNTDIPVSDSERGLRSFLSDALVARPRFKEILIGYPAMILLFGLNIAEKRYFTGVLLLFAGIGTADIIDTFAHLHTPLIITFIRLFNGLWIGILAGAILFSALYFFFRKKFKES